MGVSLSFSHFLQLDPLLLNDLFVTRVIHGCDGATRRVLLLEGARTGGEEALGLALLCEALAELGVSERERLSLWRVLAAIWHLASAGAVKGQLKRKLEEEGINNFYNTELDIFNRFFCNDVR